VWVSHFEEHSKYGVFYILSSGAVGMRFNDITCLVTTPSFGKFKYATLRNGWQEGETEVFEAGQQREALTKKIKIIHHFYRELRGRGGEGKGKEGREDQLSLSLSVYVMSHYATSTCTLFLLSNSHLHARFKDDTEMLAEPEHLTFLTKDKREVFIKNDRIAAASEDVRAKFSHLSTLVKKIKRDKAATHQESVGREERQTKEKAAEKDKAAEREKDREKGGEKEKEREKGGEKENHAMMQSCSSSKLIKPKAVIRRQFGSTANLHHKLPLTDYVSNR
jgi:hypothetical protein